MRRDAIFAVILLGLCAGRVQAQLTAGSAYDSVNHVREAADSLVSRRTAADVQKGLGYLYGAVAFMDQPQVHDLSNGWVYLRGRLPDTWKDIGVAETIRGDSARALHAFEMIVQSGGAALFAGVLRRDTIAERWHGNARYERVITQLQAQGRMWSDSAFVAPYRDSLPESERLAGLALLWAEVRYSYPDFQQTPGLSWDSLYIAYIPRVQAAKSTRDYYQTLRKFAATLGDAHTDIFIPGAIGSKLDNPPLRMRHIEGRTFIASILSPTLETAGLRVGDEIIAIDGLAVDEYARTRVAPYVSVSTPQDLDARIFGGQLLYGPRDSAIALRVQHQNGSYATLTVSRAAYPDLIRPVQRAVIDSLLPGNIGYIRINNFGSDSSRILARQAIARYRDTRALIFDVRYNGGGNTVYGASIISALIDTAIVSERMWARSVSGVDRASGFQPQVIDNGKVVIAPDTSLRYHKPIALLIGPQTFSAAENFAAAFAVSHRATLIGEPTGGSTGQPFTFPLPGGGAARVRTRHHALADGREYLFSGIQPDVVVRPTVAGFRSGRDEVLDAALRAISMY